MNNHIKLTIQSLIASYPLYSQEDILVLNVLSPYADPELFISINHFLHMERSLDQLKSILALLEVEDTNHAHSILQAL